MGVPTNTVYVAKRYFLAREDLMLMILGAECV